MMGELLLNKYKVSIWDDERVLETDGGGGLPNIFNGP